jgi:hypothetical protein
MKTKAGKIPVTMRALIQRINRKLAKEDFGPPGEQLRKSKRSGVYYIINFRGNYVTHMDVDVEGLGRELGVLREWEQVEE